MSPGAGMLAILTEPALRDELDRVGAAVGSDVIYITNPKSVGWKTWSAAMAVLLDEEGAASCGNSSLPRRAHVIVLTAATPTETTWQAAVAVGAQRVLTLPGDGNELIRQLAEAGEAVRDGERAGRGGGVVAVIGGRGGAGASVLAGALAQTAGDALLVDLDPRGGGIDLLIGAENVPGLRWPDLALQGGRLTWSALREALPGPPGHRSVSVLSGSRHGCEVDARAADAVIDAGCRGGVTVICDLPRGVTEAAETALETADLVVMVSPCDVRSCAAGSAIAPWLQAINPNIGLVVRGPSPGGLRASEVGEITGLPLLAAMRAEPWLTDRLEHGGLRLPRRSALRAAAGRVLGLLPSRPRTAVGKTAAA